MNIIKEVVTSVMINDKRELKVGDYALFVANGVCMMGRFDGLSNRGRLSFANNVNGKPIFFNVLPSSIDEIEIFGEKNNE